METKNSEDIVSERSKSKKKNKNKERKRLMTLFRGPKVERSYVDISDDSTRALKQSFIDIMTGNASLKMHQKMDAKSDMKVTNELVFGLNEVIRSVERKRVMGVVLNDPLAIHLRDSIIDLCANNGVPCVCVNELRQLKAHLNISSLTAIAFRPNVAENDAIFYRFYQTFLSLVNKGSEINASNFDSNERKASVESECVSSAANDESVKTCETNVSDSALCEELGSGNYSELVRAKYKQLNDSYDRIDKDMIRAQELFLPFSDAGDSYFPDRESINDFIAKIEITFDEQEKRHDLSFAEVLMDVNEQNTRQTQNRERCQKNKSTKINYGTPEIVRLEPSTSRAAKKLKRKKRRTDRSKRAKRIKPNKKC